MSDQPLRIIFAGTPEFAAHHLDELLNSANQVVAVYTQPDRPAGRGKKIVPGPVKQLALDKAIPVQQPPSLKDEAAQEALAQYKADVLVVVAYGLILPQAVLDIPRLGCINVHGSLLPRWRGAAPIQRAIEAGDTQTGITIMQMDAGLDTGSMLASASCPIEPHTTAASLHDTLAKVGPELLITVLSDLPAYQAKHQKQSENGVTYAEKILKPEACLDWLQPAKTLDRLIRAFNPFPICYSTLGGQRVKIWAATPIGEAMGDSAPGTIVAANRNGIAVSCGGGELLIRRLQLPGGKPLYAEEVLNSRSELFAIGQRFDPRHKD
ncbi:MAG: methionyl-tRNA formyltransferase [Halioglobus sp.]